MKKNNKKEVNKLIKKAREFADCLRTTPVSREEAYLAVSTTILKTLEYPIEVISLNKK